MIGPIIAVFGLTFIFVGLFLEFVAVCAFAFNKVRGSMSFKPETLATNGGISLIVGSIVYFVGMWMIHGR
jgi:hypothetical protein